MEIHEIQRVLNDANAQAGAIARSGPEDENIRILAIAIAETARATGELAKKLG